MTEAEESGSRPRAPVGRPCRTGLLARHFFRLFLVRFAWVFALLQLFLAVSGTLVYLWSSPFLPPLTVLASFPDQVLVTLPLTAPLACLVAGFFFLAEVRRAQGFLRIRLAGRDPREFQWPILVFGAVLSVTLVWLVTQVTPQVLFQLRHPVLTADEARLALPLMILRKGGRLAGLEVRFEEIEDHAVSRLTLVNEAEESATVVTARQAEFSLDEDPPRIRLALQAGRLLEVDRDGQLLENLKFDRFDAELDSRGLVHRSRTDMLPLHYYTNAELARLPAQVRMHQARGVALRGSQRDRVAAIPFLRQARTQIAFAPLLFLALLVGGLGDHREHRQRLRSVLIAVLALCVFLPQAVLFAQRPFGTGLGAWPVSAWLPLAETVLLFAVVLWITRERRPG
jgi:lipopolysaccharide export system permease LptF/LptG-like protein